MAEYISDLQTQLIESLLSEFNLRRRKNPSYSLRAFGRFLDINDSTLSQIIRGRRKLTLKTMNRLATVLGVPLHRHSRSEAAGAVSLRRLVDEEMEFLADWLTDAIIEFIEANPKLTLEKALLKIPERLQIHELTARQKVFELKERGFLSVQQGFLINSLGPSTSITDPEVEQLVAKRYQRDLLELSQSAIEKVPKKLRDHTSLLMAFHRDDLEEARVIIKKCRQDLLALARRRMGQKLDVYGFQFSVFPITDVITSVSKSSKQKNSKQKKLKQGTEGKSHV